MKHSFNFLSGLPLWPVGWRERSPVALAKSNQIRADQCERATEFLRSLLVGLGGTCIDDAIEWRLSLDSFASEGTKLLRLLRSLVPRSCRPIWVVKMFFSISWRGSKGLKRVWQCPGAKGAVQEQLISYDFIILWTWEIEALETSWDILRPETAVWYGLSSLIYPDWAACWWSNRIMMSSCWDCKSLSHNLHKPDPKIVPDTVLESQGCNAPEKHRKTLKPHIEAWELEKNIGKHTSHINFQKKGFLFVIFERNSFYQHDGPRMTSRQPDALGQATRGAWGIRMTSVKGPPLLVEKPRCQGIQGWSAWWFMNLCESSSVFRFQVFRLVSDCDSTFRELQIR